MHRLRKRAMSRMCKKVSTDTLYTLFSEEETQRDLAKHLQPIVSHRLVCYRFQVDFLKTEGFEDMRWLSGYILTAIWSGYLFVEKFIPYKMIAGTSGQWLFYYLIKLILFIVIGVFTAPFTCLWTVYRVIRAFR